MPIAARVVLTRVCAQISFAAARTSENDVCIRGLQIIDVDLQALDLSRNCCTEQELGELCFDEVRGCVGEVEVEVEGTGVPEEGEGTLEKTAGLVLDLCAGGGDGRVWCID